MTALDLDAPCIEHVGSKQKNGYGSRWFNRPGVGRTSLAHRAAWMEAYGAIQAGLTIDHRCLNRGCVNVLHMELVTRGENSRRAGGVEAARAKRVAATKCPSGHEYNDENTYWYRGRRNCRACRRVTNLAYWRRNNAA